MIIVAISICVFCIHHSYFVKGNVCVSVVTVHYHICNGTSIAILVVLERADMGDNVVMLRKE